jgi:hypothetical protein
LGTPEDSRGLQRTPEVSRGLQRTPENSRGLQRTPEDSRRLQRTPEDSRGLQKTPEDFRGLQRTSEDFRGLQRTPEDSRGLQRTPEDSRGLQRTPEDSRGLAIGLFFKMANCCNLLDMMVDSREVFTNPQSSCTLSKLIDDFPPQKILPPWRQNFINLLELQEVNKKIFNHNFSLHRGRG